MAWTGKTTGDVIGNLFDQAGTVINAAIGLLFDTKSEEVAPQQREQEQLNLTIFAIFVSAAYADGSLHRNERKRLHSIGAEMFGEMAEGDLDKWIDTIRREAFGASECGEVLGRVPDELKPVVIHHIFSILYADDHTNEREKAWLEQVMAQSDPDPDLWFATIPFFERGSGPVSDREAFLKVLELEATASASEIKKAYRELATQYHPDRLASVSPRLRKLAEEKMREVNAAYEALTKQRTEAHEGLLGQMEVGNWREAEDLSQGEVVLCPMCSVQNRLPVPKNHPRARCGKCYALLLLPTEFVAMFRAREDEAGPVDMLEVTCPISGDAVQLHDPEEGDEYECPHCESTITVSDGEAVHPAALEVRCRKNRRLVQLPGAEDGDEYECPYCGADILMDDGKAKHE